MRDGFINRVALVVLCAALGSSAMSSAQELRPTFGSSLRRYILSYYPTNEKRDGTLRKVEIKVRNHPEYTVLGKQFYYARSSSTGHK